ncbi:cytochrome c-type biogenesis protein CcmH [Zhongshania sp.]|uniref:cytochrome c-type biogenesis protein n=1 Tax=Zhongshania sp. TaxID=1971902 RepID=UPI0035648492
MRCLLVAGWLILLSFSAHGVIETYQFDNDVQRARYHHFIEELRCPKCQNQNLSGSDSAISKDLRRQIHQMIMDDKSDIEITQYMVARYGDFILYRPQFNAATAVLWLTPLGLLLLGLLVWWRMATRRAKPTLSSDEALSVTEQQRLKDLLDEENSASKDGDNK